ncbi:putative ferric-chelate reductase 1 [Physella acuta]|uniref:putative ferric-chelate reductase 1 n=1 Tax=Physella acuta TaxID=109671 RepID=UPI0027DDE5D8|nr:putative ferric-chelate reductase 1 [Physella acuta]
MPPVSFDKISLKDKSIFRGSAYHAIVHAHVSVMMIAWMFLTGVVTVVSRHYRDWLPKKKLFSTKVWFQVHRALAILVALLTYVGFIIMFALYGAEIREGAGVHAYIGLVIVGLVSVQLIAGMLRPNPDNKWRVYFNWGHRILGQLCHVLFKSCINSDSSVTMFLGFGMEHNLEEMKSFGFTVLGIWLAGQIVWHVAYEILSWRVKAAKDDTSSEDDKDKANKTSNILTILMVAYIIFLATLTIAGMVAFLIY